MDERIGIYILANDVVIEFFHALIVSLRRWEPDLEVEVIPFDGRMDGIQALSEKYRFTIMDSPMLDELEAVGRTIVTRTATGPKCFRKMAASYGRFDRYLFLDADIVLLCPLGSIKEAMRQASADEFIYFVTDKQVFCDPELLESIKAAGNRPFNTGTFIGGRGTMTIEMLKRHAEEGRSLEAKFCDTLEQPYLNFVIAREGIRHRPIADVIGEPIEVWAGHPELRADVSIENAARELHPTRWMPLLHWAGVRTSPRMPYANLFLNYRTDGMNDVERSAYERRLWCFYFKSLWQRAKRKAKHLVSR